MPFTSWLQISPSESIANEFRSFVVALASPSVENGTPRGEYAFTMPALDAPQTLPLASIAKDFGADAPPPANEIDRLRSLGCERRPLYGSGGDCSAYRVL